MTRKRWIAALLVLAVSNIVTFGTLWSNARSETKPAGPIADRPTELFTLEGTGTAWRVEHYNVIRTKDSIWRGNAKLVYLGDPSEIESSNSFSYSVYERSGSKEDVVLAGSHTAMNGPINLLDNLDNLGSVESPLTAAEQEMAQLELSGSYMLVEWTDSQGRSKAERIPLEVL